MNRLHRQQRFSGPIWVGLVALSCLAPGWARGADFGRLTGKVLDPQGNPLMGVTVLIMGPVTLKTDPLPSKIERILTDAQGKFVAENLLPGWYSLKVTAPARFPAHMDAVHVESGQTANEKFVLADIFSVKHFGVPKSVLATWGDDWKWVLRTSATTRPILRFKDAANTTDAEASRPALPATQTLIGVIPGSASDGALSGDPGFGSIMAYFRPLSEDADVLVAGSMTMGGLQGQSLATAFRKHLMTGDPQELVLAVHQLNFAPGMPPAAGASPGMAQAMVARYSQTRALSQSLTFTAGVELDYLNALGDALSAHPSAKLEYEVNPASELVFRYGSLGADGNGTLLDRIGMLNAFPRITARNYHPQLEDVSHTEVSFERRLDSKSQAEIALYHDRFNNAAVWGLGGADAWTSLAGDFLPSLATDGVNINGGSYASTGVRAAYSRKIIKNVNATVVYASGETLAANGSRIARPSSGPAADLADVLRPAPTQSFAGKVSAWVPGTRTVITTSYEWLPAGRVTDLDPYGRSVSEVQPFLGVQIRQPLPNIAFIPAHIEALADFQNLMAQGYLPISQSGQRLILTPAYRSFRGGFSVEF